MGTLPEWLIFGVLAIICDQLSSIYAKLGDISRK